MAATPSFSRSFACRAPVAQQNHSDIFKLHISITAALFTTSASSLRFARADRTMRCVTCTCGAGSRASANISFVQHCHISAPCIPKGPSITCARPSISADHSCQICNLDAAEQRCSIDVFSFSAPTRAFVRPAICRNSL